MKTPMVMKLVVPLALLALAGCATAAGGDPIHTESTELWDASRGRKVPVALYFPAPRHDCTRSRPCPVALASPGYGLLHTDYGFMAKALAESGYLVVAVQHDLPTDPPLGRTGDLFADRMPMWKRGVENLLFVRDSLSPVYPRYDWSSLVLVGHSNGGDISALALHESPAFATTLVTLDNRRYPLPRSPSVRVLSVRGSDFEADAGVLPSVQERNAGTCITEVDGSHHNDMNDHGPIELQVRINALVLDFLEGRCAG